MHRLQTAWGSSARGWSLSHNSDTLASLVTVPNYSPNNVARPGAQWSLMAEVSETEDKPVDTARILEDVVEGLRACGLISDGEEVVSRWHRRLSHGYPTPWLGRDAVLEEAETALREHDVFSRGRFGAWKYEVSNQDHSVMQPISGPRLCTQQRWPWAGPPRFDRALR